MKQIAQYAGRHRAGLPHAGGGRLNAGPREADGDGERGACEQDAGASVYRACRPAAGVCDGRESAYDVLYNQADVDGLFTDFPDAVEFIHRK